MKATIKPAIVVCPLGTELYGVWLSKTEIRKRHEFSCSCDKHKKKKRSRKRAVTFKAKARFPTNVRSMA